MDKTIEIVDWIHLPNSATYKELWNCFHDSEVVRIKSDLLQRTLIMTVVNDYIAKFHTLSSNAFHFRFEGVKSARVISFSVWPGKFEVPKNINREQESKMIEEYQSKWREESLEWNKFEKEITSKTPVLVSNAFLAFHDNQLGFKIQSQVNEQYHEIFIRADSLLIFDGKQKQYELDNFEKLGQSYWEAFSKK